MRGYMCTCTCMYIYMVTIVIAMVTIMIALNVKPKMKKMSTCYHRIPSRVTVKNVMATTCVTHAMPALLVGHPSTCS